MLGPIDLKGVFRDSFMRWMTLFSLSMGLLIRWGIPALNQRLQARYGFDLTPYYPLIMSVNLVLMPTLAGMVVGFLLLDEKDDRTLSALQVTPLTLRGYLIYRLVSPMIASVILTMMVLRIADLTPISLLPLLILSIGVAPLAPLFALFLASFANNKVQGMALTKANGFLTLPPVVAWFVHSPWEYAFGLAPTYWPCKAFWLFAEGQALWIPFLLVGIAFQAALLIPMARRFLRTQQG